MDKTQNYETLDPLYKEQNRASKERIRALPGKVQHKAAGYSHHRYPLWYICKISSK